jgi:hypothetical protein
MPTGKNKPFVLHHCCRLLETSEKWKLREQETPPPRKEALINLDNEEETNGGWMEGGKRRPKSRERTINKY